MASVTVAGIDCGTNSIRLKVARVDEHGMEEIVPRTLRVIRLGQDVDQTHRFADEALERAYAAAGEFAEILREHPVDGGEKFHNGVDLAVNTGTNVLAFAEGTVDYIGDSPVYGLYLQLSHAGGLKSFYCHCDKLCVQQGQSVAAGEKVAESGATGNATGPHLHFELKLNGTLLNPLYYIETQ